MHTYFILYTISRVDLDDNTQPLKIITHRIVDSFPFFFYVMFKQQKKKKSKASLKNSKKKVYIYEEESLWWKIIKEKLKIDWIFIFRIIMGLKHPSEEGTDKKKHSEKNIRHSSCKQRREWKLLCIRHIKIRCECSWKPQNMRKEFSGKMFFFFLSEFSSSLIFTRRSVATLNGWLFCGAAKTLRRHIEWMEKQSKGASQSDPANRLCAEWEGNSW